MTLHDFIQNNLDAIGDEWEAFARTLLPASRSMSHLALRNHCHGILLTIVADMQTSQTDAARSAKSRQMTAAAGTIAAAHGALRQAAGFDAAQVVSEFRALRSSVLALWRRKESTRGQTLAIEEIARFNEAIDQALEESIQHYSNSVAASRTLFLAVLGHDLRSPLQGIQLASHLLAQPVVSESTRLQSAARIARALKSMSDLIADLLEVARSRLGRGIPINRSACDMRQVCDEALDAVAAAYPQQNFVKRLSGDLHLPADALRMRQVLANLLNNAAQHGDPGTQVLLSADGEEDSIVLAITNSGKVIPPDALQMIFEPLVQMPMTTSDLNRRPTTSLGLGLFIVREIVLGHLGTIDVQSTAETGTVFTIRLPREPVLGPGSDALRTDAPLY